MSNWKKRWKPLAFLPLILMMCIIWTFSSRDGEDSAEASGSIGLSVVRMADRLFHMEMNEEEMIEAAERLQPVLRKGAHVTEFFLLALTAAIPLYVYGLTAPKYFLFAGLFCVLYAISDEWHQSFVPERSAKFTDVLIDSAGIAAGILLAMYVSKRRACRRAES